MTRRSASRLLLVTGMVAATGVSGSVHSRAAQPAASAGINAMEVHGGYVVAPNGQAPVGYFTLVNHGRRADTLLGVTIGGFPVEVWHRRVNLTAADLENLRGCGQAPDAPGRVPTRQLQWTAVTVPAGASYSLGPGLGRMQVPTGSYKHGFVTAEFDFDYAGSVSLRLPVRASNAS
jgi:hypothetical protein